MIKKPKNITIAIIILLVFSIVVLLITCSKDEKPEIVGCNSIKYKGKTYSNVGCAVGIRSFNIEYGDGVCFHVECSGGCISSVSLCSGSGSMNKTVVGPND